MAILPNITVVGNKKPIEFPEPKSTMQYDKPIGPEIPHELVVDGKTFKYTKTVAQFQPTLIARDKTRQ